MACPRRLDPVPASDAPCRSLFPPRQVAAMMALEVLPTTLLMFPAGQAAITAGLAMYGKVRHGPACGAGQGRTVRGW